MRLILDSHILPGIALNRLDAVNPTIANAIARPEMDLSASTASLWDIAVKARLGKLDPGMPIDILPSFFEAIGIGILPISA